MIARSHHRVVVHFPLPLPVLMVIAIELKLELSAWKGDYQRKRKRNMMSAQVCKPPALSLHQ
jgi:hypothetical protein